MNLTFLSASFLLISPNFRFFAIIFVLRNFIDSHYFFVGCLPGFPLSFQFLNPVSLSKWGFPFSTPMVLPCCLSPNSLWRRWPSVSIQSNLSIGGSFAVWFGQKAGILRRFESVDCAIIRKVQIPLVY